MNSKRSYILEAFVETPWAILPSKLVVLEEIVIRHVSGEKLDAEEIQARIQGAAPRPQNRKINSVAVLPLFGVIIPRADFFEEASGATSAEKFGKQFAELLEDPSIDAIVLDVDSPGGQVGGIPEVSKQIYDARGTKPIIAVANQLMASAAYWIGTAADELVITPSGEVGSVGVFSVHNDISSALEKTGIKLSLISAGKYKVEGNPWQPLTEDARTSIQARVNDVYDTFVNAIARNRGVSPDAVRNGYGEGRVVSSRQAVELGMADRVETLAETIDRLFKNAPPAAFRASVSDESKLADGGQAPASVNVHTHIERALLKRVGTRARVGSEPIEGENSMYLRELLKQRADLVARATALVEAADKENRDLTDEERIEFNEIMGVGDTPGKVDVLDAQIVQIQGEREKLRAALEKKFASNEAIKPEPNNAPKTTMKKAEFDALSPKDRMAFVDAGGRVEE